MASNRLNERLAQPDVATSPRFSSKHEHAAYLNANLKRPDIEWIVDGTTGGLRLVDREEWSRRRTEQMAKERERERQRYNWRMLHPIGETREASE